MPTPLPQRAQHHPPKKSPEIFIPRTQTERAYHAVDSMLTHKQLSSKIKISLQDNWTILGVRGSGKTTFARHLLPQMNLIYPGMRAYILDSKGYGEFDDYSVLPNSLLWVEQYAPTPLKNVGVQVWKPPLNDLKQYNDWFGFILRDQKPCVILVDEISSLATKKGTEFPDNFTLLLKQGRIMDEAVISMSQEMAYIDRNILGQMTHFLRFYLINRYDLREANKLLGFPQPEWYRQPDGEHAFFYRNMTKPTSPTYEFSGYQEFLYQ